MTDSICKAMHLAKQPDREVLSKQRSLILTQVGLKIAVREREKHIELALLCPRSQMRYHMIMRKSGELIQHSRFTMEVLYRLLAIISENLQRKLHLFVLEEHQRKTDKIGI